MPKRISQLVRMLEGLPSDKADALLANLRQRDPQLAQQIADRTVTFDDLRFADDKGLRTLLETVDRRRLHLALRGADDELLGRFLANLSRNGGLELRDALENMPPQRRSEVDKARGEIVKAATLLLQGGTLVLQRPGTREKYV